MDLSKVVKQKTRVQNSYTIESTPRGGWIGVMLILRSKSKNATIDNMNDANGQLKSRSEAGFPMKSSIILL